jgi:hypothetical protein
MCRKYINSKRGRMLLDCSLHTFKKSRPTKMTFILHKTNQTTIHRKPHSLPDGCQAGKLSPTQNEQSQQAERLSDACTHTATQGVTN